MVIAFPSPQTTLVVLLGANEWPYSPEFQSSHAFTFAARRMKEYFLNAGLFGLPKENLLDLFNSRKSPDEIDQELGQFLEQRIVTLQAQGNAARDVVIYFVGHGGFAGHDFDFYLAIRRTRTESLRFSGIHMIALAETLREKTRHTRLIVILDCCFSAAAFRAFQSNPSQVAVQRIIDAFEVRKKGSGFPNKGIALLCSSDHKTPSLLMPDESSTMFSEALVNALSQGETAQGLYLSLRDVRDLVTDQLRSMSTRDTPNPILHSPDQSEGDVADVPFFPNTAARKGINPTNTANAHYSIGFPERHYASWPKEKPENHQPLTQYQQIGKGRSDQAILHSIPATSIGQRSLHTLFRRRSDVHMQGKKTLWEQFAVRGKIIFAYSGIIALLIGCTLWLLNIVHIIRDGPSFFVLPAALTVSGIVLIVFQRHFYIFFRENIFKQRPTSSTSLHTQSISSVPSIKDSRQYLGTVTNQRLQSVDTLIKHNANIEQERQTDSSQIFHFNERLTDYTEFFGRGREQRTLINRTRQRNSTSIVGPRRIGKTWLLDYLRLTAPDDLGSNFRIALLDTKMPNLKTVADFTARVLDAFGISLPFASDKAHIDMLEKFVTDSITRNVTPVLCIDEFEGFFDQAAFDYEFFENLRFIADKCGLVLVTVSKHPLMDLVSDYRRTSPFFNIFEQLSLEPFDESDAQEFTLVKSMQAGFTEDERLALLQYGQSMKDQSGWPPLRLQLVGKQLLEDKNLEIQEKQRVQNITARYYNPQDQNYWQNFEERVEAKYRAVVSL